MHDDSATRQHGHAQLQQPDCVGGAQSCQLHLLCSRVGSAACRALCSYSPRHAHLAACTAQACHDQSTLKMPTHTLDVDRTGSQAIGSHNAIVDLRKQGRVTSIKSLAVNQV